MILVNFLKPLYLKRHFSVSEVRDDDKFMLKAIAKNLLAFEQMPAERCAKAFIARAVIANKVLIWRLFGQNTRR